MFLRKVIKMERSDGEGDEKKKKKEGENEMREDA